MNHAGSLPHQGQPGFPGQQPQVQQVQQSPQMQQHHQQQQQMQQQQRFAQQQQQGYHGQHQGYVQQQGAPQQQQQQFAFPGQQMSYDYNNFAHMQQTSQQQAQPQPQQQAQPSPQQQQIHRQQQQRQLPGQNQWGMFDGGSFGNGNNGGAGGMQMSGGGGEQYMPPANAWQHQQRPPQQRPPQQQQQGFHVPSPQMAQGMMPQGQFQLQGQGQGQGQAPSPHQMAHIQRQQHQQQPQRSPSMAQQAGVQGMQGQQQMYRSPSMSHQQQQHFNMASPQMQHQLQHQMQPQQSPQAQYQQYHQQQQRQMQMQQQQQRQQQQHQGHQGQTPSPSMAHQQFTPPVQQNHQASMQSQQWQAQQQQRRPSLQPQRQPTPQNHTPRQSPMQTPMQTPQAQNQGKAHPQIQQQVQQQQQRPVAQSQPHRQPTPQGQPQPQPPQQPQHRPSPSPQPKPEPEPEPQPKQAERTPQPEPQPPTTIQPQQVEEQYQPPPAEQMQFVNLQDIQSMPISLPQTISMSDLTLNKEPMSQPSLQPAAVIKESPSSTPRMSNIPSIKSEYKPQQSPRVSASQSPAGSVGRVSKSPAVSSKPGPQNSTPMMVALAEELITKARAAATGIAGSMQPEQVDEYQKMIGTGLGCLEAALASQRLSPRQEARVRLRYAAVLHEETDNIMEAETTLTKGITLCDKHRMPDLKYCMQYLMMKALSQRNRKAALKALDQHISDSDAYKHVHWSYAFRLLKASFYMETGSAGDATALENLRSIQSMASSRGDAALSVYASLTEALILLKTSKGTPVAIQQCLAQASKYQLDPQVQIPQLELMYMLVDYLSSLHREKQDAVVERLRSLQKKCDECQNLATKPDFLIPIRKGVSSAQTIGDDVSAIVKPGGDDSDSDYLVITFVTQMELMVLVFTMAGLTYLHKPMSGKTSSADLWRQGLKILGYWNNPNMPSDGPALSLGQAVKQKEWRADMQCYLNLLLGLFAASQCSWDAVKHHLDAAEGIRTESTFKSMLDTFFVYLKGVHCQGVGDFDNALLHYQNEALSLDTVQPKQAQRHLALLAAMNRLWIMQRPSHQNDVVTMELLNEVEPICREHYNVEIRGAWSGVKATVVTNPPRQRNQRKEDAGRALGDVKASTNALATTIGLVIARDLLYNNVIGDQAWKCMQAAAHWANKSHNPLWQSVVDGILVEFFEAREEKENAKRYWDKGVEEAKLAFTQNS